MAAINEGSKKQRAKNLANWYFENEDYDRDDIKKGLFLGQTFVKVCASASLDRSPLPHLFQGFKCVYTGPQSARWAVARPRDPGRACKSQLANITSVEDGHIAYIASVVSRRAPRAWI